MQLVIIKQEISRSFRFQNQHIYCDKYPNRPETIQKHLVESQMLRQYKKKLEKEYS